MGLKRDRTISFNAGALVTGFSAAVAADVIWMFPVINSVSATVFVLSALPAVAVSGFCMAVAEDKITFKPVSALIGVIASLSLILGITGSELNNEYVVVPVSKEMQQVLAHGTVKKSDFTEKSKSSMDKMAESALTEFNIAQDEHQKVISKTCKDLPEGLTLQGIDCADYVQPKAPAPRNQN